MAAWFGYGAVGFDVRDDAVLDCQRLAAEAAQSAPLHLQSYHVQDMRTCAQTAGKMAFKDGSKISKFGGLFTSIPFWKMERYEVPGKMCHGLMEHVRTYDSFLEGMEKGFRSAISCLEPGAPVLVHCQEFRDGGKYCDLPRHLANIFERLGLIQTETITVKPASNSAELRMVQQFESKGDSNSVSVFCSILCFKTPPARGTGESSTAAMSSQTKKRSVHELDIGVDEEEREEGEDTGGKRKLGMYQPEKAASEHGSMTEPQRQQPGEASENEASGR